MINYAHRGASGYYPENTMLSFEKALEMGSSGIETDVQLSLDGVLVLIHDETLERTSTTSGYVKNYSYSSLKKLNVGSYLDESFNESIPTLEELLIFAKGKNIILNLELKNGIIAYEGLEEKVIAMICKHNMEDVVILSSFNHYSMVKCKELSKNIKTGLLYMEGLYHPESYCKMVGADGIHPFYLSIDDEITKASLKEGLLINPYTINDRDLMKKYISMGVSGIITNYPDILYSLLNSK